MEEYIFLILAILFSVIGAFNRNKGKKGATPPAAGSGARRSESFLEQLLGTNLGIDEPLQQPTQTAIFTEPVLSKVVQEKKKKNNPQPFLTEELARNARERELVILNQTSKEKEMKTKRVRQKVSALMDGFSMKKAVVYSEILQRKY